MRPQSDDKSLIKNLKLNLNKKCITAPIAKTIVIINCFIHQILHQINLHLLSDPSL